MSKIHVVAGGQFGSEAKGAVAAFLSQQVKGPVVGVRVGGPNAGHTVYGACHPRCTVGGHPDGGSPQKDHPWRLRQIPVLAVSRPDAQLVIAAGSEIDVRVLMGEIDLLESAGYDIANRLIIDRNATIIMDDHKVTESEFGLQSRLGSTAKGIGAARADRIMRTAPRVADMVLVDNDQSLTHIPESWMFDTVAVLAQHTRLGNTIIVEGTQGYGLGLHTKYYPFVTSGDCRAIDFLAQAGISPWGSDVHTWLVIRPNPIRVAGNSGPLKGETTWHDLGLPEEKTTVTQKVRRVGGWDADLVNDAILANGGPSDRLHLVLTMVDHKVPDAIGATRLEDMSGEVIESVRNLVYDLESGLSAKIELIGTGPRTMMWYRGAGIRASHTDPLLGLKQIAEQALKRFGAAAERPGFHLVEAATDHQHIEGRLRSTDELTDWWLQVAQAEVKPMVDKALEYGGKGAAIDLIDIGTDIARMNGRDPATLTVAELTELGIVFYARGKMSRITAAVMEGRFPSDDSWYDLGIYARMAQRTRAVGGWPYKSMDASGHSPAV